MLAVQAPVYARAMQISELAKPAAPHANWLVPDWPVPPDVRALCTTRAGGVSVAPYDSMNLGAYVGDAPHAVAGNIERLTQALGARPVMLNQVHGTHLLALDTTTPDGLQADGSFTGQRALACTVGIADCLPILLCHVADGRATQVGALHAGWRGLAGHQGLGVVEAFFMAQTALGRPAAQWQAWLGPCIGPQAFEVGSEVRTAFMAFSPVAAQAFVAVSGGKFLADLAFLARQRLAEVGVHRVFGNDGSAAWCTVGNPSKFFSYRRDRVTGRQVAAICLL